MELKKISKGTFFAYHTADRFRTTVLSLSVLAPLDENTSCRALMLQLLARTTKKYPTTLDMNRRLASLYGATITPVIRKQGEIQVLSLVLSCVDDRFALDNESICNAGVELLCDCLLLPDVMPDGFKAENVEREKGLLKQQLDSENDDTGSKISSYENYLYDLNSEGEMKSNWVKLIYKDIYYYKKKR